MEGQSGSAKSTPVEQQMHKSVDVPKATDKKKEKNKKKKDDKDNDNSCLLCCASCGDLCRSLSMLA